MTIALATVFLLLGVSPGAAFLTAYARGVYRHRPRRLKFQELLPILVVLSIVPHVFAIALYHISSLLSCSLAEVVRTLRLALNGHPGLQSCGWSFPLDGTDLVLLIAGPDSSAAYGGALAKLGDALPETMGYFMLATGIAVPIGWTSRWFVRSRAWDLRVPAIAPQPAHFYMLSGNNKELELAGLGDSHPTTSRPVSPDIVVVTVAVDLGRSTYLYSGALADYELDDDGGVRRILMSAARRRPIADDRVADDEREAEERFYSIDGDALSIEYSHVKTMNVQYVYFEAYTSSSDDDGSASLEPPLSVQLEQPEEVEFFRATLAEAVKVSHGAIPIDDALYELAVAAGYIDPPRTLVALMGSDSRDGNQAGSETEVRIKVRNHTWLDFSEFLIRVKLRHGERGEEELLVLAEQLVQTGGEALLRISIPSPWVRHVSHCSIFMALPVAYRRHR